MSILWIYNNQTFPQDSLCPKCHKFLAELFELLPRCENCEEYLRVEPLDIYLEGYPQIDGETFKLCPECFKILKSVVQEIEDIFH